MVQAHSASPATSALPAPPADEILVVDDDEVVRSVVGKLFESVGFHVTAVQSSVDALSCLAEGRVYKAVITDLVMPGQTGVDLLHRIRALGHRELPVIILTGHPTLDSVMSAIGDGRVRYLLKTEAHEKLLAAVQELTGGRTSVTVRTTQRTSEASSPPPSATHLSTGAQPSVTQLSRRCLPAEEHRQFDSALQNLRVAFQPIVSAKSQSLFGYEALVRSGHDVLSNPGLLFDAAERLNRIWDLGRRVRELVARRVAQGPAEARIFVNVHSAELNDPDLLAPDAPLSAFAGRVVLEITERASLGGVDDLKERLKSLRSLGFTIALDDLGVGYAGLASFALLDPEVVKLDVSLVRNIDSQARVQRLVGSLLHACTHGMDMTVVCEGVETPAERDTLIGLGADLLQGYLFGHPAYDFGKPKA